MSIACSKPPKNCGSTRAKIETSQYAAFEKKSGPNIGSEFAKGIYFVLTATLTTQVEKLKTQSVDGDQWKRGQSRSRRGPRDNRHPSQTPRGNTEIIQDQCWYHETYGNEAKKVSILGTDFLKKVTTFRIYKENSYSSEIRHVKGDRKKSFSVLDIKGKKDTVSINRLKPAYELLTNDEETTVPKDGTKDHQKPKSNLKKTERK